jgi:hypothetical protein
LIILELVFGWYYNSKTIESTIAVLNQITGFSVTYDGLGKSFLPGFILYNTRVSMNFDGQHNPLIAIPELVLKPDILKSVLYRKIIPGRIVIKNARWDLRVNKAINSFLDKNLSQVLKTHPEFQILLKNNIMTLTYEKKNYEREKWNIKVKKAFVDSGKSGITASLYYDDKPWGKGEIFYQPDLCPDCSLKNGQGTASLKNLPVNRLSWFFKDYKLVKGEISLETAFTLTREDKNPGFKTNSELQIKDILVTSHEDKTILEAKKFQIAIDLERNKELVKSVFLGKLNKSGFQGNFEKTHFAVLPENFRFILENSGNYTLPLFYGYSINGIKKVMVEIRENPDKQIFREISGDLVIANGRLTDIDQSVILQFPQISFHMEKNKFNGQISAIKGKSDINLELLGSFTPVLRKILTHIEFDDYTKNKIVEKNAVFWNINEEGKFSGKNILWIDFADFYKKLENTWNRKVNIDGFKGWRPSILREREWFQSFFFFSNYKNEIFIENWQNETPQVSVTGSMNYTGATFETNLVSGGNYLKFIIDANSNYPVMRGELEYTFNSINEFAEIWLPPKFANSVSSYKISSNFVTSGERLLDISNNYIKTSRIFFNDVKLHYDIEKNQPEWQLFELNLRQYGKRINANYSGFNENSTITGWGSYNDNEDALWKVKNSIVPKRTGSSH